MVITLAFVEATAVFAAVYVTLVLWTRPLLTDSTESAGLLAQAMAFSLCYLLTSYYSDLYDLRIVRRFSDFLARLPKCIGIFVILMVSVSSLIPQARTGVEPFAASLLNTIGLLLVLRAAAHMFLRRHPFRERVLIVGTGPLAWRIAKEMEAVPHLCYSFVGFVDDGWPMPPVEAPLHLPYSILGPLQCFDQIIDEFHPDRIIVALTDRRGCLPVQKLVDVKMTGTVVKDGIEVYERLARKLDIESLTRSYLIFSKEFKKSRLQMALHRTISLVLSTIGLILTAPVMAIIALAIKLDSSGPVFFIQERAGLKGRIFRLVKFRTMHLAYTDKNESVWERDITSRVTWVGKWLRKLHLDELPQFINILKGEMDLIGPRPEMISNVKTMTEEIPYYSLRHIVRPGLTGWAQINNGYAVRREDLTEKVGYDLYYVKHMSLWLDLRILLATVKIVLCSDEQLRARPWWQVSKDEWSPQDTETQQVRRLTR